jgi:flagellin
METSMARLSTGKRINSAADDAAGVAIASRLTSEIRGTDQAIRNALDGPALIDTAEGGHKEIAAILQRMREISVQAGNDTNSSEDRANLQTELDALVKEIDRIAGVKTWASNSVMNGTGTADTTKTFALQIGSATGGKNQISISIGSMSADTLNVGKTSTIGDVAYTTSTAVGTNTDNAFKATATNVATTVTIDGVAFTTNSAAANKTVAQLNADLATQINASDAMQSRGITANATTVANEVTLTFAEGNDVFVDSAANSRTGIVAIDAALLKVSTQRSELGAVSNRLSHTVANLTNISTNLSSARGGIEDADFALETTQLAKNQILQQASTAMLAQANASKQNVLSLLQ